MNKPAWWKDKRLISLLLGIVGMMVVIRILSPSRPTGANASSAPDRGLGQGIVRVVAEWTGAGGGFRILGNGLDPSGPTLAAIQKSLVSHPGVVFQGCEMLPGTFDPVPEGEPLAAADFLRHVERVSDTAVIVSFAGLPLMSDEEIEHVIKLGHQCILVSLTGIPPDERLFSSGLLKAAILPRLQKVPLSMQMPSTPDEWFEREYQVIKSSDELSSRE